MHEAFIKREVITLDSLRNKLYERGIVISRSTIHRYIRACGFTYKRRGKDRCLSERPDIIVARRKYLRSVKKIREEGLYNLVYTDETWLNARHTVDREWLTKEGHGREGVPQGKGSRLIIVDAGTRHGFLPDAQLLFRSKSTTDYHEEMCAETYMKWITGVVDSLDAPHAFVIDNAPYHTVSLKQLTRLTLSHNKVVVLPPAIADLTNLEILNLFNNHVEELPTTLSALHKLKILNLGMNRLCSLPRGFGAFPVLEVLDLTYNNLNESSLPGNFFCLETLRALYLGDNDFEQVPADIGKLKNLQILVLRDNDLFSLPKEIGNLGRLKELHIQGNRLTVLPPELGNLDLVGMKQVFKGDSNPWVPPIADQFQVGISHVFDYIRSDTYKYLYGRHIQAGAAPPPKTNDKSKKISRKH